MHFLLSDSVPLGIVEGGQGHGWLGAEVIVLVVRVGAGVRVPGNLGLDRQYGNFFGDGDGDCMIAVVPGWTGGRKLLVVHCNRKG